MNNAPGVTAVCWQTRNVSRHRQATEFCKNYGLRPLTGNLWIGMLKPVEQNSLVQWFEKSFTKKTEKFHCFPLCKNCYESAILGKIEKTNVSYPQFEIIE